MPKKKTDPLMREQLDERLKKLSVPQKPKQGWLRVMREALGISRPQLAKKLGMIPASLAEIEINESKGTASIATIQRVAEAMGCHLEYVVSPREPSINALLMKQAERAARRIIERTEQHMRLEAQGNSPDFVEKQIKDLAQEMVRKGGKKIWEVL